MGALSKEAMMDKEHVKGAADEAKGAVKDAAGKMMDDKKLQAEGKMDKAKGEAREALGEAKDALKHVCIERLGVNRSISAFMEVAERGRLSGRPFALSDGTMRPVAGALNSCPPARARLPRAGLPARGFFVWPRRRRGEGR
jgi:uncharacterized protein YjbJ (UPF0337 family)